MRSGDDDVSSPCSKCKALKNDTNRVDSNRNNTAMDLLKVYKYTTDSSFSTELMNGSIMGRIYAIQILVKCFIIYNVSL